MIRSVKLEDFRREFHRVIDHSNDGDGPILLTSNGAVVGAIMGECEFFDIVSTLLIYKANEEAEVAAEMEGEMVN